MILLGQKRQKFHIGFILIERVGVKDGGSRFGSSIDRILKRIIEELTRVTMYERREVT